jgi:hypothetical protein
VAFIFECILFLVKEIQGALGMCDSITFLKLARQVKKAMEKGLSG